MPKPDPEPNPSSLNLRANSTSILLAGERIDNISLNYEDWVEVEHMKAVDASK